MCDCDDYMPFCECDGECPCHGSDDEVQIACDSDGDTCVDSDGDTVYVLESDSDSSEEDSDA